MDKNNPPRYFFGNSEIIGDKLKSTDWSDHPLGSYDDWPSHLKNTLGIALGSDIPMILFWGSEFNCFYNDAFVSLLDDQDKHFNAIGKKGKNIWADSWKNIKPKIDRVLQEEESIQYKNLLNVSEEKLWTYEFNPVRDHEEDLTGVLIICQKEVSMSKEQNMELSYEEKNHILESITDGYYEINEDWIITSWNQEAENILGIKRNKIIGQNFWDVFPEGKELKFYSVFKKVMKERIPTSFEEFYEPWGKWFTFDVYPTKEGISAYFRDITEQRRLKLINERTEEISGVAGWEYDVLTEKVFMTPKAYEIYDIPKMESLDPEINKELFDKQSLKKIDNALEQAINHEESYQIELTLTRKDDENKIIRVSGFPQTESGKVTKVYGTLEDITQEKKDKEELEEAYEKLKTAQQIAKMGYWTHDIQKNKGDWSEETYNIWELDPDNFAPNFENLLETIHPEDKEIFLGDAEEAFPDKNFYDSEHRIITPNGTVKWILERITLHRDEEGNPKLLEGIAQDITEQKKQEEKIREALKEKEILLAEIHHRVKNNLAVVSGMMQLQAFEEPNEELKNKLLDSVVRIGSMATIHEQLYQSNNFSKLDFSENLKALVKKIIDTMQNQTDISLEFNLDSIQLNVNQAIPCSLIVNEVITNIIKHAFKGRETGIITINQSEEDKQICLSIKDDGIGIPEDFDMTESNTLGHHLIKILSEQLEASYDYVSSGDETIFSIKFAKSEIKGIGNISI